MERLLSQGTPFDPALKVCIQDTVCFLRINSYYVGGDTLHPHVDTIPERCYAPSHEFTMNYDSTCAITYMFTECRLDDRLWTLARWWRNRQINADAGVLGFNSRTIPATLHAGDSITFFRYLRWRDPRDQLQDTSSYYALDALDFSVELVRTSDSMRIVLLDSVGIEACSSPGRPLIHGMRGLLSTVNYRVPSQLDGVEAFLRVRPWHNGSGPYWFTRADGVTLCVSNWLNDTSFTRYNRLFDPPSAKYAVGELQARVTDDPVLSVVGDRADPSNMAIVFNCSPDDRATAVAIYDIEGNLLFAPYITAGSHGRGMVHYRFPRSGVYFVALLHDGRLVATRSVTIIN
ncbi:MAG: hypothetical protein JST22_21130 [Bacteroidetes bacterium]|nr:hypothetical protein [Bacteroidota bacterium]